MKVDESIKIIFYLTQRGPLSRVSKVLESQFSSHKTVSPQTCRLL